jgi:hypothetical protein
VKYAIQERVNVRSTVICAQKRQRRQKIILLILLSGGCTPRNEIPYGARSHQAILAMVLMRGMVGESSLWIIMLALTWVFILEANAEPFSFDESI